MTNYRKLLLGTALALGVQQALAVPFSGVDPRSLAMGGTGVASGSSANASFFNPALLAAPRFGEDFGSSLAGGAYLKDEDKLRTKLEDFQDNNNVDKFERLSSEFESLYNRAQAGGGVSSQELEDAKVRMEEAGYQLLDDLESLGGSPVDFGGYGGFTVAVPSKTYGVSFFAGARGYARTTLDTEAVDGNGQTDFDIVRAELAKLDNPQDWGSVSNPFETRELTSEGEISGAIVSEVGISLATELASVGGIAVGVSPKMVRIDVIELVESVETIDPENDHSLNSYTDFNIDVGVVKDYGQGLKVGLTVRNLLSKDYEYGKLGRSIELEPQLRIGGSYDDDWFVLSADFDLTENAPMGEFGATQYFALGAEFDAFDIFQVRAGYRNNLADDGSNGDVFTFGLGLSYFVHFDIGAAISEDTAEVSAQFGLRW